MLKRYLAYTLSLAMLYSSSNTLAAIGSLSETPLYLRASISPNVLWVLDDSTSMEREIILTAPARNTIYNAGQLEGEVATRLDYDMDTVEDLLRHCFKVNATAFNPDIVYTPWQGVDEQSSPAEISNEDLARAHYAVWQDEGPEGNGVFDPGECGEQVIVDRADSTLDDGARFLAINGGDRAALIQAGYLVRVAGSADEENYRNWYRFYRNRLFSMKAAFAAVVQEADFNYGMATINADSNTGNVQTIFNTSLAANRQVLLDNLFDISVDNRSFTPLRRALQNAGRYFAAGENPENNFIRNNAGNGNGLANPITESCQKNYTVLMTDGFGYEDQDRHQPLENLNDVDGDGAGNTLADIAMHYNDPDLFQTDDGADVNEGMEVYGVSFGAAGTTGKLAAAQQRFAVSNGNAAGQGNDPAFWNEPSHRFGIDLQTIDDLMHAALNTRGEFHFSEDPAELAQALQDIVADFTAQVAGTASTIAINTTGGVRADDNNILFQSLFDSENWSGDLLAHDVSNGAIGSGPPSWSAAEVLESRDFSNRVIFTWDSTENNNAGAGIVFDAPTSYTQALNPNAGNSLAGEVNARHVSDLLETVGRPHNIDTTDTAEIAENQQFLEAVFAWIRGDRSQEGTRFREREALLGDIVNSNPQYVSVPIANYPNNLEVVRGDDGQPVNENAPYQAYVTAASERLPVVYVGSNDGMLHAFQATLDTVPEEGQEGTDGNPFSGQGRELFAYLPELLFSSEVGKGLHLLPHPQYVANGHKSYVDGLLSVQDVFVNNNWATYLAGSLGAGGKGVYVLDITDPSGFSAANVGDIVKTEFSHPNMGFSIGRPQLARVRSQAGNKGGEWVAIFGNGYNNTGHGDASLFILYLDGNEGSNGPLFREIRTDSTSDIQNGQAVPLCTDNNVDPGSNVNNAAGSCNGLSSPSVVDLNNDMTVDRVYAGDVQGNMWAFDLTNTNPALWGVAHGDGNPLFIACTSANADCPAESRQPITARPTVVRHPSFPFGFDSNLIVLFGTGEYVSSNANNDQSLQSFYGIWDAGNDFSEKRRAQLTEQTITETPAIGRVDAFRSLSDNTVDYDTDGNQFGWYIDLPDSGERVFSTAETLNQQVAFATLTPEGNACEPGGSGWIMVPNILTGGSTSFRVFGDGPATKRGHKLENSTVGILPVVSRTVGGGNTGGSEISGADIRGELFSVPVREYDDRPSRRAGLSTLR